MIIYVKTLIGETIILEIEEDKTIEAIKQQVQTKLFTPIKAQRLYFNNEELEDNKAIKDTSLYNEATIHLVQKIQVNEKVIEQIDLKEINIQIQDAVGSVLQMKISIDSTVGMLKERIKKETQYSDFNFTFPINLDNSKTLEESGITDNTTFIISRRLQGGRHIV